ATGYPVNRRGLALLVRPLTPAQDRALYAEWLRVGRLLGLRERDMPATPEEFWPYYRRMLATEVESNAVVRELLATDTPVPAPDRGPLAARLVLRLLWPLLLPPALRARRFLTTGFLPADARAALGLDWTPAQERRLRRLATAFRLVVPA
ncbi:oxygenase MpaB family protein, partial [Streptomyces sp. SPB074]|uniref:oxygenase MpaB family protein n=1 Tax=Streptomyces sp. (strain SPB074) TaxID=465543 RepID=UPI0001D1DE1C